jgi:hypothetical protein
MPVLFSNGPQRVLRAVRNGCGFPAAGHVCRIKLLLGFSCALLKDFVAGIQVLGFGLDGNGLVDPPARLVVTFLPHSHQSQIVHAVGVVGFSLQAAPVVEGRFVQLPLLVINIAQIETGKILVLVLLDCLFVFFLRQFQVAPGFIGESQIVVVGGRERILNHMDPEHGASRHAQEGRCDAP